MIKNFSKQNSNSGFTLIETMIGISIFLFIIVFGVTSLLNAFFVNQRSNNIRSVIDSLSYAMDDMSRNIRAGYLYKCLDKSQGTYIQSEIGTPGSCQDGYGIAFETSDGNTEDNNDQWVYYFTGGKLYRSTLGLNGPIQISTDEIKIDEASSSIMVYGAEDSTKGNNQQPLVVIRLTGTITQKEGTLPFSIQTAVSSRITDN